MRRIRKKMKRPRAPWDAVRLEEEGKMLREFGLRRKREIWSAEAIVRSFRRRARNLIAMKDEKKMKILLDKLTEIGLIQKGQGLDQVLQLKTNNILERRLQTIVYKKGHASSIKDARQKIVHGHVYLGGRRTTFPSFIVSAAQESVITVKGGNK
jgi:small subunit ribosomal protein S4